MARIIVVEEDPLIRALLVEWLSAEGYRVDASNRADSLADDDADLVIVDVFMPRRGGSARLRDLRQAYPRTPLIAISGQFTSALNGSSTSRELGVHRVIGKPFTRERLLCAVRDAIVDRRNSAC